MRSNAPIEANPSATIKHCWAPHSENDRAAEEDSSQAVTRRIVLAMPSGSLRVYRASDGNTTIETGRREKSTASRPGCRDVARTMQASSPFRMRAD
jgi:hypothetical protein